MESEINKILIEYKKKKEEIIKKSKIYIKNPTDAPKGVKVEIGPEGGHYYESDTQNINQPKQNDEPQREIGSKEYLPKLKQYIEENLKTPEGQQKLKSLNLENTLEGIKINVNFANLMTYDKDSSIRWNATNYCDMEHLHQLVNDTNSMIRQRVAERIDQNGLHIMLHNESEANSGVQNRIARRIDLSGLEYIIDKWSESHYEAFDIANERFPYVRFLTPIVDEFQKTGQINLNDQFKNYIKDTIEKDTKSSILIEATNEFYNIFNNSKYHEFHEQSKNDWEQSSSSNLALLLKDSIKRQFGGEIRYHDTVKDMDAKLKELYNQYSQELVDNYVKIQKQLTRAFLDVAFPNTNEINIYRGTTQSEVDMPKRPLADLLEGKSGTVLVKSNSLSSWTLKKDVAKNFAHLDSSEFTGNYRGIVLQTKISKEDIWSTFFSHAYLGNEREILVIGKDRIVNYYENSNELESIT